CALCASAVIRPVSHDVDLVCVWADVEADAGDDTNGFVAPRLLAAQATPRSEIILATDVRKNSAFWAVVCLRGDHARFAGAFTNLGRPIAICLATGERGGELCRLYLANFLARRSCGFLPASRRSARMVASRARSPVLDRDDVVCFRAAQESSLSFGRLALVFDHAPARDRDRGGWPSGARRPLHLFAAPRSLHRSDLAHCRAFDLV